MPIEINKIKSNINKTIFDRNITTSKIYNTHLQHVTLFYTIKKAIDWTIKV